MRARRKGKKTGLDKKLMTLWGSIGREGARCEVCETLPVSERYNYSQLHAHHIIGRGHKATRWDLRNRIFLCPNHHTLGDPMNCAEFNIGGWFLNWDNDNDWMGQHRIEDKEYLRQFVHAVKKWEVWEMEELLENLKGLKDD